MSINPVLTSLPPPYSLRSDSNSPSAKSAALAEELREKSFAKADISQATSPEVDDATHDASATKGDPGHFQSTLDQTLREGAATARRSTSGPSQSSAGQSSPAIALYQRVSQYGSNEPSNSALLQSWNKIMQADSAAAAFAKLLSRNGMPGSESGVLDLTA